MTADAVMVYASLRILGLSAIVCMAFAALAAACRTSKEDTCTVDVDCPQGSFCPGLSCTNGTCC